MKFARPLLCTVFAGTAMAQSTAPIRNTHIGFERPESWAIKRFTSASILSGLTLPEDEGHRVGSISLGLDVSWLPVLDTGQKLVGFDGRSPEDLNKAPIIGRPVIRVGLPWKFSAFVAGPPPIATFGIKPRLLSMGVERPVLERGALTVNWRGYGQVGSVKGAFTCPSSVLSFAPGSPQNPTRCVGTSEDIVSMHYVGTEFQAAYRIPSAPKWTPHVAVGGNLIDGAFRVHAPIASGLAQNRQWTRGLTFDETAGITYQPTKRTVFTLDTFYTPLWVQRTPTSARSNDGLFNLRAQMSYTFN